MSRDIWRAWRWREEPEAPRMWDHPERMVVLADDWIDPADPHRSCPASRAWRDVGGIGPVYETTEGPVMIMAERAETLRWLHDVHAAFSGRMIPALRVERQADLTTEAVRALCAVKAQHRALVISPREEITLGEVVLRGRFIECPDETQDPATDPCRGCPGWTGKGGDYCGAVREPHVDLVVVRGSTGPDAWPIHPAWVRSVKAQCDESGVAFALMSWGDWKPTGSVATWEQGGVRTYEEQGVAMLTDGRIILEDEPAETIRARDRAAGYHVYSSAIERDRTAIECMHAEWRRAEKERRAPRPPYDEIAWFYRVGAERSGRELWLRGPNGGLMGKPAEYLGLPEGL